MIFGNPGIYDEFGDFSSFAIQIDNIANTKYFSINLCLNMNIYPKHLTVNSVEDIAVSLDYKDLIFNQESDELFNLSDKELMIELIKRTFPTMYEIECLIGDKSIDYLRLINDYYLYDMLNLDNVNFEQDFYWDIDNIEYKNVYPFIINSKGLSKIIIIYINESESIASELSRFFTDSLELKKTLDFFDESYWKFDISVLPTEELISIVSKAHSYLLEGKYSK